MRILHLLIYVFFSQYLTIAVYGASYTWKPDRINIYLDGIRSDDAIDYKMSINIESNGALYQHHTGIGQYMLNFTLYSIQSSSWYYGITSCIPQDATIQEIAQILSSTRVYDDSRASSNAMQHFMTMKVKKYQQQSNSTYYKGLYLLVMRSETIGYLNASLTTSSCDPARTVGYWSDIERWYEGSYPTSHDDDIIIPAGSGAIIIENSMNINSLSVYGGMLVAGTSSCPIGYTSIPGVSTIAKCYKLVPTLSTFYDAESYCRVSGGGILGSHLMEIGSIAELDLAKRLCRGYMDMDDGDMVRKYGCWIGLQYDRRIDSSSWLEPAAIDDNGYRAWNRNLQLSVLNDTNSVCSYLHPWQSDPLSTEQGSFLLDECYRTHAYICQAFGRTVMHDIITNQALFDETLIVGGNYTIYGDTSISMLSLSQAASFTVYGDSTIQMLLMNDGATSTWKGDVTLQPSAYIGEPMISSITNNTASSSHPIQSRVNIPSNTTIRTSASSMDSITSTNITINAYVDMQGQLFIDDNVTIAFIQGGDFSRAKIHTQSESSAIILSDDTNKMESFDSFELKLAHRGPVTEEIASLTDDKSLQVGIYRLRVSTSPSAMLDTQTTSSESTDCIPYNATADQLEVILSKLSIIQSHGGVSVRRYGVGQDSRYHFGYVYRIEYDCVSLESYLKNSVINMQVDCYGYGHDGDCGCRETKVPIVDKSHASNTGSIQNCPHGATSSFLDPRACVYAPSITLNRITKQSQANFTGTGSIILRQGVHRLPSYSDMNIIITNNAVGIVSSDIITWKSLSINSNGKLLVTGPCWQSWDIMIALYLAPNVTHAARRYTTSIDKIPPFQMNVVRVRIEGAGKVYTGSRRSNMTWSNLFWSGGEMGGISRVSITSRIIITTNVDKILRYGIEVYIPDTAVVDWLDGDITMIDGSRFVIDGDLVAAAPRASIGYTSIAQTLQQPEMLHDSHGYYPNPLCNGTACVVPPSITLKHDATFTLVTNSNISFLVSLKLLDTSLLKLDASGSIIMNNGGICGDEVVIDMSIGSRLILTDGEFNIERTCVIRGEGELVVLGGKHALAYLIDATIKILSGTMIWPIRRGAKQMITFNGGLHLERSGILEIQPFSTTMIINQEVILTDNAIIRFPDIGIATQPAPSDRSDAPDDSPRGNFTIKGIMRFHGGTMSGKVDINALNELYLDGGTKNIRSLAKLVNYGRATWGTGDILMENNADFLNLGDMQVKQGIRPDEFVAGALVRGVILPIENGGDVYAENYHSYDVDQGHLTSDEYINLRTKFVSRVPDGWTENLQTTEDVIDPL